MADINKVALLVCRAGEFLMCRKNNTTSKLILPGGTIESGESDVECLERELSEELGNVTATGLLFIGEYSDIAANDDASIRKTLSIRLYQGALIGEPSASSEIAALVWCGIDLDTKEMTPIMNNKILPDLNKRRLLPW
ncbi:MAG: NUDIX domain-containing protein [Spirochaetota bacterium]